MNTERIEPSDTIAAVITAQGEAAVAAVRISGPGSLALADRVFRCREPSPSRRPTHTIVHGEVIDATGNPLDEAILLVMRGPHSFTGEDVIEIQCHGGRASVRRILHRVLEAGCRSAQPGEFTQRAFLNGRMDLLQAEAVLDLIRANSDRAAALAVEQMEGALSARFHALYDQVLALASDLEAAMDFSEDEMPPLSDEEIQRRMEKAIEESQALLQTWNEGRLVREGLKVSILGPPNAGKSTLFNALLGIDRAIVSDLPGTTRDTLEEGLILDGVPLRLIDTAGLRPSSCSIEQEGIRRSIHFHKTSELIIYMIDGTVGIADEDCERILATPPSRCILVVNKQDLGTKIPADAFPDRTRLHTSLKTAEGAVPVRDALRAWIQAAIPAEGVHHAAISERHRQLLLAGLEELHKARELLRERRTAAVDLVAHHLRAMLEQLGMVTGRIYHEELLQSVFSRFCIGK